jgi:hypothetical protein
MEIAIKKRYLFDMSHIYWVLDITPCQRYVDAMDGGRLVEVGGGSDDTDGATRTVKADFPVVPVDS